MINLISILLSFSLANFVDAGCKLHNAEWLDPETKGPVVSTVSRSDPTRVKVDWTGRLDDQRCVDNYTIYYWRTVDPESKAQTVRVPGPITNRTNSHAFSGIEPCVDYKFRVELEQNGVFTSRVYKAKSGVTQFKSPGLPKLKQLDKVCLKTLTT